MTFNGPAVFRWLALVLAGVCAVALAVVIGMNVPSRPLLALAASAAVLTLGITAAEPAAVPLIAMPLLLAVQRIGGSGVDLSISDAALIVATLLALVFTPRPFDPALRNLLWLSALYQGVTLLTVVANPFQANIVEWFHAWVLVSGSLIVGWTIGRSGHARLGLSLLLVAALVLAFGAIAQGILNYAKGDFSALYPSWPYPMHKNFVGTVMGFAAVIAYARPPWMGWSKRLAYSAFWIFAAALMMTQSRQAIIGLGVALVVLALRRNQGERRSQLILLAIVPAMVLVGTLVKDQVQSGNQFNSVFQRITWFQETIDAWLRAPWLGHGLRFWKDPSGPLAFQPPNAIIEMLASAGVIGLVAFLCLTLGALVILWRLDPAYGTLAFAILLSRLMQAQLDLYWVSVQGSIPWVVAGICIGALSASRTATWSGEALLKATAVKEPL